MRALERQAADPPALGLDTRLVFSVEQFSLGIFPAMDPVRSSSTIAGAGDGEAVRRRLADAAELRAWFHQPMFLAQDYTGEEGVWADPEARRRSWRPSPVHDDDRRRRLPAGMRTLQE